MYWPEDRPMYPKVLVELHGKVYVNSTVLNMIPSAVPTSISSPEGLMRYSLLLSLPRPSSYFQHHDHTQDKGRNPSRVIYVLCPSCPPAKWIMFNARRRRGVNAVKHGIPGEQPQRVKPVRRKVTRTNPRSGGRGQNEVDSIYILLRPEPSGWWRSREMK